MKTDEEIYEKFRWEIDNEKPDILFTDTMGWNDRKGVLDEDKVIRTYNRHLRKAISLTKQAERKRISLDLEPINEIIREIEGNYKMIDNVPQHIITLIKRWRDFRKKEVRRNDKQMVLSNT